MSALLRGLAALGDLRLVLGLLLAKLLVTALAALRVAQAWQEIADGAHDAAAPSGLPDLDLLRMASAARGSLLTDAGGDLVAPLVAWALGMALVGGGILARLAGRWQESFGAACARCAPAFVVLLGLQAAVAFGAAQAAGALEAPLEHALLDTKRAALAVWLPLARAGGVAVVLGSTALYLSLVRARIAALREGLVRALLLAPITALRSPFSLVLVLSASLALGLGGAAAYGMFAASGAALSPGLGWSALGVLLLVQVASRVVLWGGEVEIVLRQQIG